MKKFFAYLLALCMVLGMLPATALAEEATGGSEPTYVAYVDVNGDKVKDEGELFTTLAAAVEKAEEANATFDQYGDLPAAATVVLLTDLTISEQITIEKPVKVDLAGNTLTCTAKKAFEVHADAIFGGGTKDTGSGTVEGKILNTHASGRCIDTRTNVTLKVQGITLQTTGASNPQPLTIGGSTNGTKVTVFETTIDAGKAGYAIISFVETELTIEQSSLTGYSALYMKEGSSGSTVSVNGSTLTGDNQNTYDESNSFGTIVLTDDDISLSVFNGSSIVAKDKNGSGQVLLALGSVPTGSVTGANVTPDDVTLTTTGTATGYLYAGSLSGNTVLVPSDYVDEFEAEGYVVDDGGYITNYSAPITTEAALKDAIANATNGDIITLEGNITLTETLTIPADKTVTLDLNGKTISQEKACTASYSMIINNGNLTIKDSGTNGKISFKDTTANGGSTWGSYTIQNNNTLTVDSGTVEHLGIPYVSGTSYSGTTMAIQNYTGSVTINGGTIFANESRSIRMFASSTTNNNYLKITGGVLDGQVWLQNTSEGTTAVKAELIITGGTFSPNGPDGSSVYIDDYANCTANMSATITGGTFTTKVGAKTGAAVSISGGKFTETAKNNTNSALLAEGCTFAAEAGEDGYYEITDSRPVQNTTTGEKYNSLAEAIADAEAGQTVTLLKDVSLGTAEVQDANWSILIDKAITLDGGNKTLTSTAGRAINVSGANGVTIKNLTINCSGERAINIIQNATNVTIDSVTATAANYTVNVASSAANAIVTIKNSDLTGLNVVNVGAAGADVTITNTKVTCNDQNENEGYNALTVNKTATGATIAFTSGDNGSITVNGDSVKASVSAENGTITIDGKTDEVVIEVAYIEYGDYYYSFTTLKGAVDYATGKDPGATIVLIRNVTLSESVTIPENATLELNNKTITAADGYNLKVEGKVYVVTKAVTGVTLSESTKSLTTGGSFTLIATVEPSDAADKSVTWNSDNESVATVSDGVVTAVAAGTANITVTTTDGEFTATCEVTVSNPVVTMVGGGAEKLGDGSYAPGVTVTIFAGGMDGKTFSGWTAEGVTLADATKATTTFTMPANDVTVTANWTVDTYTITLNANGGSVSPATATATHDVAIGTLPTPTRGGYWYFNGWYTAASGGSQVTAETKFTADTEIFAQWYYDEPYYPDPTPVTPPTTTEKTENEDGSTTTTVTDNKTGTVTETTENVDGSTTTVETQKDGTVTEKVENTDGSTQVTETKSETTTNKDGSTTTTTATKTESTDASGATVTETKTEEKVETETGSVTTSTTEVKSEDKTEVTETKAETTVKEDGTTETKTESTTTATDAAGNVTTSTTTATETTTVTDEGATVTEKVEETKSESAEATVETKTTATTTATEEKTETVAVTEETVTKTDGTVETKTTTTTETALADGTTGTAVTDESGKTEATVTISEEAAASEEPVALPIPAVTTTTESEAASTITVTTNSEENTKVEIPVAEVNTSTVAVIVNEDGTETVITETKMTDEGLVIDVPDGATVKIVDNSTDFHDVEDHHWEEDAIDFASARGLVNGVGNNLFDKDGITTRAHVVTLLARLAGVDTTPDEGETWYDKGHDWAVENGITYAGNMNGAITRHEMMTLLWRYMGSPKSDHDISHFTDIDGLTAVTEPAARWAVEIGLVGGHGNGTMTPTDNVTRGQLAQFMMNFVQKT